MRHCSKGIVVSDTETAQKMRQVWIRETNKSELPSTCRKVDMTSKLSRVPTSRLAWKVPGYCPSGVRHIGSVNLIWAQVLNCRNLRLQCLREKLKQRSCEAYSTEVQERGGAARSSVETVVMTGEQRGCVIWSWSWINQPKVGRSA